MGDADLDAIRAKRMSEMQEQMGGNVNPDQERAREDRMKQVNEMKNNILHQVLDQEARARLNNIALTKPEKAKEVEAMLCQMAQRGQIPQKLGEQQLKSLLERVGVGNTSAIKVKFDRRRANLDSDSD